MTGSTDQNTSEAHGRRATAALADYADRLLLGTGLDAADAVLIASGAAGPTSRVERAGQRAPGRLVRRGSRVSVALFDLGQRLRAATLARPVARSTFAPVLPPIDPVAITLTGAGDGAVLRAADGAHDNRHRAKVRSRHWRSSASRSDPSPALW